MKGGNTMAKMMATQLSKKSVAGKEPDRLTFIRCPKCKTKYIQEKNPKGCPGCNTEK